MALLLFCRITGHEDKGAIPIELGLDATMFDLRSAIADSVATESAYVTVNGFENGSRADQEALADLGFSQEQLISATIAEYRFFHIYHCGNSVIFDPLVKQEDGEKYYGNALLGTGLFSVQYVESRATLTREDFKSITPTSFRFSRKYSGIRKVYAYEHKALMEYIREVLDLSA